MPTATGCQSGGRREIHPQSLIERGDTGDAWFPLSLSLSLDFSLFIYVQVRVGTRPRRKCGEYRRKGGNISVTAADPSDILFHMLILFSRRASGAPVGRETINKNFPHFIPGRAHRVNRGEGVRGGRSA